MICTRKATSIGYQSSIVHLRVVLCGLALLFVLVTECTAGPIFQQTNLVSSVPGLAPITDANLKNPWGISFSPSGPFWVSNQVTGTSTLYNGSGEPFPVGSPLVVSVTSLGTSPSGPTGQVYNPTSDFGVLGANP